MIPGFNERGHLPSGLHKTNIEDFKTRFVDDVPDSETRPEIFSGYKNYCNDLLKLDITMKQWLDGGFTTNKINPNDLDVVSHVDALKINNNNFPNTISPRSSSEWLMARGKFILTGSTMTRMARKGIVYCLATLAMAILSISSATAPVIECNCFLSLLDETMLTLSARRPL